MKSYLKILVDEGDYANVNNDLKGDLDTRQNMAGSFRVTLLRSQTLFPNEYRVISTYIP